ncbi:MAG: NUDIX domain-containing protein [Opitutaceae bacterium]|nr:NUDIX domain-containing protein [Cytophagales bacterium]
MADIKKEIENVFGNQLRIRVSGVCLKEDSILLIKHLSIGKEGVLWAPPGGGMKFGETIIETLKREFLEETGLIIETGELILVNEYLESPLHAIELFFKVTVLEGELKMGSDPEMSPENQIISEIKYIQFKELALMESEQLHSMFNTYKKVSDFLQPVLFQQNIKD